MPAFLSCEKSKDVGAAHVVAPESRLSRLVLRKEMGPVRLDCSVRGSSERGQQPAPYLADETRTRDRSPPPQRQRPAALEPLPTP